MPFLRKTIFASVELFLFTAFWGIFNAAGHGCFCEITQNLSKYSVSKTMALDTESLFHFLKNGCFYGVSIIVLSWRVFEGC